MHSLKITERAESDLLENALYIKDVLHSERGAQKLVEKFFESIQPLADLPESCPFVHDDFLKSSGIRYLQVENYTAFYTIEKQKKEVVILRFMYSRRNWAELFLH